MASIISAGTTSGTALNMAGDTSGQLQLATNGSTTAITIDTSQNVGIGTTTPTEKLEVIGSINVTADASYRIGSGTDRFIKYRVGNSDILYSFDSGDFYRQDIGNSNHSWFTGNAERMRIDSSGNVFIGDTAQPSGFTTVKFYVKQTGADWVGVFINSNSTAANCYGSQVKYTAASPNGTGNEFFAAVDSSVTRMTLRSNGGIANYSGNNVNLSDQREKTNIELAGSYLDKVCAIPVKTFNYIDQNMEEDGGLTLGVIAQDVQAVAPELVSESNWGTEEEPKQRLSIYQTDLQYALMKCIQEQQTIINDLKARIETLEAN
jgi:hypothetical protein